MTRYWWHIILVIAVAAGGAACGGSGGSAKPVATGTSTGATSTSATSAPPTPVLSSDARTAIALGSSVDLLEYRDPKGRYVAQVPRGWELTNTDPDEMMLTLPGDPATATIGISCAPGLTVDDMIARDDTALGNTQFGALDLASEQPAEVAGVAAREVPVSGRLGNKILARVFVYFAGAGCAWRVQMTTFPGAGDIHLRPLLDRVLGSFKFS